MAKLTHEVNDHKRQVRYDPTYVRHLEESGSQRRKQEGGCQPLSGGYLKGIEFLFGMMEKVCR